MTQVSPRNIHHFLRIPTTDTDLTTATMATASASPAAPTPRRWEDAPTPRRWEDTSSVSPTLQPRPCTDAERRVHLECIQQHTPRKPKGSGSVFVVTLEAGASQEASDHYQALKLLFGQQQYWILTTPQHATRDSQFSAQRRNVCKPLLPYEYIVDHALQEAERVGADAGLRVVRKK